MGIEWSVTYHVNAHAKAALRLNVCHARGLVGKLPEHAAGGRIIVRRIAGLTGYANYTVYQWLHKNRLTPRAANALIVTFEGRITKDDLVPFVFG